MGRLIYSHMMSLDGFIETDPSYAGPNWATADDDLTEHFLEAERAVQAHLYGRRVYEQVAAWWPRAAADSSLPRSMTEYGKVWVDKPKVVFSTTLTEVGSNTRIVRTGAAEEVANLKAATDAKLTLYGGVLASSLISCGLVDELHCYVNPVLVGRGTPMFPGLDPILRLELLESRQFDCGVVLLKYSIPNGAGGA
jgi:dihydrofolate reductase